MHHAACGARRSTNRWFREQSWSVSSQVYSPWWVGDMSNKEEILSLKSSAAFHWSPRGRHEVESVWQYIANNYKHDHRNSMLKINWVENSGFNIFSTLTDDFVIHQLVSLLCQYRINATYGTIPGLVVKCTNIFKHLSIICLQTLMSIA